ncbi:hypothetical protein SNOG_02756 [Parastagonospora nodorum SN15]|uniref:Uncharacterized protein n=1 Tax=Phaeosphaeria nodorum (strain SN15 / ATCC MYA-4574 / FGSC 10173) TaxID=321614 RepID=Q0UZQ8_PHANO|nr:hypothetical protein SNOG_02756 [Parastagonospora nodorum SN15]EAT89487.1 hypothetical protein SNOG_02756 [Parastagonospora nodorum SN15]
MWQPNARQERLGSPGIRSWYPNPSDHTGSSTALCPVTAALIGLSGEAFSNTGNESLASFREPSSSSLISNLILHTSAYSQRTVPPDSPFRGDFCNLAHGSSSEA